MQFLISSVPNLSKLQKEGGGEGRRKINNLTRLITLGWALIQSSTIAFYLKRALFNWNLLLAIKIIIWLTTGAMIVLWLSEIITEYGLGNGASLLIYTNIVSNLPNFGKNLFKILNESVSFSSCLLIIILFFTAISGIVLLQEATRIIPLISSKQLNQKNPTIPLLVDVDNSYMLPLKFNQAGVMPIILTTAILIIPTYVKNLSLLPIITLPSFLESSRIFYWISYFVLILLFSSFYSKIVLKPEDIANDLQKQAVSIPGIRPGIETTFYLKQVMKRITYLGAIMLAILSTLPNLIETILPGSSFNGLGTTSLLILVGVILDLSREVRNIVLSNIYNERFY